MLLRPRLLLYVALVMTLVLAMLTFGLAGDWYAHQVQEARERAQAVLAALGEVAGAAERAERQAAVKTAASALLREGMIAAWVLREAGRRPVGSPGTLTPELAVATEELPLWRTGEARDGETFTVYVRPVPARMPLGGLGTFLVVFLVGTLFLATVIYFLLWRLVLRPVEQLAGAARRAAGQRVLAKIPETGRKDEIGTLLSAYNRMADELNDLRANLERRVAEATAAYQRASQQLVVQERLTATGRLAAGVAHEINNPLGGMLNAARTLAKELPREARQAQYVELLLEGLSRIQAVVQNMLRFSRQKVEVGPVEVAEVLQSAHGFCAHRLQQAGIEYRVALPQGLPKILAARAELVQVLLNLMNNAIDALAGVAHPRLELSAEPQPDQVKIQVRDNGCGMDAETLAHCRDLFYTTKPAEGGTGLGLAIAAHIVNNHGGTLQVDSEPGQGTTVSVSFQVYPESRNAHPAGG